MTLTKNKIKYIQSLKDKRRRDEYSVFIAEGDKMVRELLSILRCEILVAIPDFISSIDLNSCKVEEIIEVTKEELEKVSLQKNPQQVLAIFQKPKYNINLKNIQTQLSLALDGIQDPGNMGTIIRLADWYGIEDIFCSKDTVDVYNPKVVQATMGALARVRIHYIELPQFLINCTNIPIFGLFLDGENMYTQKLTQNGIIVMGNEGNGIRPEIEKIITNKLFIPNYPTERNTSESLNVAIATAIICSEFRRRIL